MPHSHEQTMESLAQANEARVARFELRRRVEAREVIAAQVLVDVPDFMRTATVATLLSWQHRWGVARVAKCCAELGLPETKTLGSMTLRQRSVMAAYMPEGDHAASALWRAMAEDLAARFEHV